MTSAQVVETSVNVISNSPSQDYTHPDDRTLLNDISSNNLFPEFQSAYRSFHSTKTALMRVCNDILLHMNKQHVVLLLFLDLSAAFDTVYHDVLLHRLEHRFGILDSAISWVRSYLTNRTQRIVIGNGKSSRFDLNCGVPQGSCLAGPLLFSIYTSELFTIIKEHLPSVHYYADDTQIYYMEESVLLGTKPLVDSIRHFIRDSSGVFSVCHLCECRIVQ